MLYTCNRCGEKSFVVYAKGGGVFICDKCEDKERKNKKEAVMVWKEARMNYRPIEDLFVCDNCKTEFSLESKPIIGKKIFCPVCKTAVKAWQKDWET